MICLFVVFLVFVVSSPCLSTQITNQKDSIFNVLHYGALGDGNTDDTHAFKAAWKEACGATKDTPTLLIPIGKTFKVQPVSFEGPCKSQSVHVKLLGTIIAPSKVGNWKWNSNDRDTWIRFYNINGLVIGGGGVIDGQGNTWWSCKSNGNCQKPSGGSGYARKITFKDIILQHVQNPVIITQQYVDNHSFGSSSPKKNKRNYGSSSAVALSDITYNNVRGTSESEEAIQLICDKNVGCTNIVLEEINITSSNGGKTHATCQNAHGTSSTCMPNVDCLH
ncbi:hypothetical protein TanjilG_16621 [Lupinus angustifolius]|uniref:Pectate lyase superfamily protein domain-containing protein n=1 Tax=Lupinus angustifolius TaxID=3871 RepID=A0A4P1QZK2_LUPAN|nr:hypothetical protein TanjilG_16621 [Lupinus angustifolius]